jgi:hypothetical protein
MIGAAKHGTAQQAMAPDVTPWNDHPVWTRLSDYSIGPQGAALGFVDRLARENACLFGI